MKTQNFGQSALRYDFCDLLLPKMFQRFSLALKDYRNNRENGDNIDNDKHFPSAGLDELNIISADWQNPDKWPDRQGRYWWTHTLNNGRVASEFYWKKDEARGFPDRNAANRYWFIVCHGPTNTQIEGFSLEPDYDKGFANKSGCFWYDIKYNECGAIQRWMQEKDAKYLARMKLEKLNSPIVVEQTPLVLSLSQKPSNSQRSVSDEVRHAKKSVRCGRSDRPAVNIIPFKNSPRLLYPGASAFVQALKNYRENNENKNLQDNSPIPFPSAGFELLEIANSNWQGRDKWPDNEGRYWWKLMLNNEDIVEDFYWTKDTVRGFPDKNDKDRYWFIVHHASTGIKIEGFSHNPDHKKGFPDQCGNWWYCILYEECGPIQEWMEQKNQNDRKPVNVSTQLEGSSNFSSSSVEATKVDKGKGKAKPEYGVNREEKGKEKDNAKSQGNSSSQQEVRSNPSGSSSLSEEAKTKLESADRIYKFFKEDYRDEKERQTADPEPAKNLYNNFLASYGREINRLQYKKITKRLHKLQSPEQLLKPRLK